MCLQLTNCSADWSDSGGFFHGTACVAPHFSLSISACDGVRPQNGNGFRYCDPIDQPKAHDFGRGCAAKDFSQVEPRASLALSIRRPPPSSGANSGLGCAGRGWGRGCGGGGPEAAA